MYDAASFLEGDRQWAALVAGAEDAGEGEGEDEEDE